MDNKAAKNLKSAGWILIIIAILNIIDILINVSSMQTVVASMASTIGFDAGLLNAILTGIIAIIIVFFVLHALDGLLALLVVKNNGKGTGVIVLSVILLIFNVLTLISMIPAVGAADDKIGTIISLIATAALIVALIFTIKYVGDFKKSSPQKA